MSRHSVHVLQKGGKVLDNAHWALFGSNTALVPKYRISGRMQQMNVQQKNVPHCTQAAWLLTQLAQLAAFGGKYLQIWRANPSECRLFVHAKTMRLSSVLVVKPTDFRFFDANTIFSGGFVIGPNSSLLAVDL